MTDKIKTLIAKIKMRIMHNRCYNEMESKGIAVFGMCSGKYHILAGVKQEIKIPYKQCTICRYFREVADNDR